MYKFLITIQLEPGTRDQILAKAADVQKRTRAEAGCIAYDFFTCTDNADLLLFVECFASRQDHQWHCEQGYTQEFIRFHEQFHLSLKFELVQAK